ncbi:uncharacterized protein LOC117640682 [Thrips palmi]|uniref:Uncharacterized protein LOC117640682 n=1 Tax=Thrips palmi TaxID=161013 RepID=A0A6P8Y1J7_THRPL|nr:uncharacterized protein LOC117640682 [Thrips palmi]
MAKKRRTPLKPRRVTAVNLQRGGMQGKGCNSQLQRCIIYLYNFFRTEANKFLRTGKLTVPLTKVPERVAKALGLSVSTVRKYLNKHRRGSPLKTPTHGERAKPLRNVDKFTEGAIRRLIYELHRCRRHFTVKSLLQMIRERGIDFHGGKDTLIKLLKDMGFAFRKRDGRRYLLETPRITLLRIKYLKLFMEHKKLKRYFVYLDETWFFQFGSNKCKIWQDSDIKSCPIRKTASDTGKRYILIHAGGCEGFVEGAALCYCSGQKPEEHDDFHGQVNAKIMKKYYVECLLPNLPETPCVIIQDNASYHRAQDVSFSKMLKQDLINYLNSKGIYPSGDPIVPVLKKMAESARGEMRPPLFQLLAGTKHHILQLPPYHPHYNPIELIWGIIKRYYDSHVGRDNNYSEEMCLLILNEALALITPEVWAKTVSKVENNVFQDYFSHVPQDSQTIKPFIIHVGNDDSDDSDFEDDPDNPEEINIDLIDQSQVVDNIITTTTSVSDPFYSSVSDHPPNLTPVSDHPPNLTPVNEPVAKLDTALSFSPSVYYSPPLQDFSLQWSYIPHRKITIEEIEGAVHSILDPLDGKEENETLDIVLSHKYYENFIVWERSPKDELPRKSPADSIFEKGFVTPDPHHIQISVPSTRQISPFIVADLDEQDSVSLRKSTGSHSLQGFTVLDHSETVTSVTLNTRPGSHSLQGFTVLDHSETVTIDSDEGDTPPQLLPSLATVTTLEEAFNMPDDQMLVMRRSIILRVRDLILMKPLKWLNDEIINFYGALLMDTHPDVHIMDTFFFIKLITGDSGVLKWTKNVDIFDFRCVLFPIHLGAHWALCSMSFKEKKLCYYDSLDQKNQECLEEILVFISQELTRKRQCHVIRHEWSLEHSKGIPSQNNGSDCGVFVLAYERCICENKPVSFDSQNFDEVRLNMAREMLAGKLDNNTLLPFSPTDKILTAVKRRSKGSRNLLAKQLPGSEQSGKKSDEKPVKKVRSAPSKKLLAEKSVVSITPLCKDTVKKSVASSSNSKHSHKVAEYFPIGKPPVSSASSSRVTSNIVPKASLELKELVTSMSGVFLVQSAGISQRTEELFKHRGNAQCTAIAACAISTLCLKTPPYSREDLNTIVREGDSYYGHVRESVDAVFLSPEDLISPLKVCGREIQFDLEMCGGGQFIPTVDNDLSAVVENAVQAYQSDLGRCGFIFVGHTKSVCFIHLKENQFFYFNSHCVDRNNRICHVTKKGAARLFRCLSIRALLSCLLADHPRDNGHWLLYAILLHL